jgi:hypothetical protein
MLPREQHLRRYKDRTEADMKRVVRDMEKEALTGVKQRVKDLAFTHGVHNARVSKLSCNSNLARLILWALKATGPEYLGSSPFANANSVLPVTGD